MPFWILTDSDQQHMEKKQNILWDCLKLLKHFYYATTEIQLKSQILHTTGQNRPIPVTPSLKVGQTLCKHWQAHKHIHICSMQGMLPEREGRLGLWRMVSPGLEVGMCLHEELRAMKWSFRVHSQLMVSDKHKCVWLCVRTWGRRRWCYILALPCQ